MADHGRICVDRARSVDGNWKMCVSRSGMTWAPDQLLVRRHRYQGSNEHGHEYISFRLGDSLLLWLTYPLRQT